MAESIDQLQIDINAQANRANKVIDTFDGKKTTIKEYFKENSVLNSIPVNSIVYLKDGKIVSGEDFLKDLYKYIDKYKNFVELRNSLINLIEYK